MEELARLEREIKAVDDQTAAYDVKCQRHKRTLEEVKDEVRLLLIRLDCYTRSIAYTLSCSLPIDKGKTS